MGVNNEPVIGIRLRVLGRPAALRGRDPQGAIGRLQIPQFQPGHQVPVFYDSRDPRRRPRYLHLQVAAVSAESRVTILLVLHPSHVCLPTLGDRL